MYKLDRNSFKAGTVEEADNHSAYYIKLSWKERFRVAMYLNSIAFKLVGEDHIKMNKKHFTVRSRE
jgi:hypothetical protein